MIEWDKMYIVQSSCGLTIENIFAFLRSKKNRIFLLKIRVDFILL